MTKIPSVEIKRESQDTWEIRYGEKLIGGLFLHDLPRFLNDILTQALTDQRTALLTELREYTANLKGVYSAHDVQEAIKAHINNLINPTK